VSRGGVTTGLVAKLNYAASMRKNLFLVIGLFLASSHLAQAQEREWSLDATDQEAFLLFGVPNTDDVGISFWCKIGSKIISAYMPASFAKLRAGETTMMNLSVDGKIFRIPAKTAQDSTKGKFTVEGSFSAKDKLVESLTSGQQLSVAIKGHLASYPLNDADFPGLISACNGDIGGN